MPGQIDRAQVTDGDLISRGIQGDLGAQIGGMHHADMRLGRADIGRVLEGDPGMAGLEQHRQHPAPQFNGLDHLKQLEFARGRHAFIFDVTLLERLTVKIMQVRGVMWREQGPVAFLGDPFHKQIRHPVGGVHIMRAAPLIAGIFTQLQKILDIQMPGFEIGADRALALAALIHGHGRVVGDLHKRHHALGLAVGALDMRAQRAHRGPVIAEAAGELGEQRVILDGREDPVQVVRHGGQIATGKLRAAGAGIKQGRGGAHKVESGQ